MNQLVCGCMYRSFSDVEANLFFRFTSNDGKLSRQDLQDIVAKNPESSEQPYSRSYEYPNYSLMKKILINFAELDIILNDVQEVKLDAFSVTINRTFAKNLQAYLLGNRIVESVKNFEAPPSK